MEKTYKQVNTSFYDRFLLSIPLIDTFLYKPNVDKELYRKGLLECSERREGANVAANWVMTIAIWGQIAFEIYTLIQTGQWAFCKEFTAYKDDNNLKLSCEKEKIKREKQANYSKIVIYKDEIVQQKQTEIKAKFAYDATLGLFLTIVVIMVQHWHVRRCNSQYAIMYAIALWVLQSVIKMLIGLALSPVLE